MSQNATLSFQTPFLLIETYMAIAWIFFSAPSEPVHCI